MFQTIIKDILSVDRSIHLAFLTTRGPDNEVEVELVNKFTRVSLLDTLQMEMLRFFFAKEASFAVGFRHKSKSRSELHKGFFLQSFAC